MTNMEKIEKFEALWGNYISKRERLNELKGQGRYGYQLRMPKKAISIAAEKLNQFCLDNGIESPF